MQPEQIFLEWVRDAPAGHRYCYHRGHLAQDRRGPEGQRVAALADTVYRHANVEIPIVPPTADYHIRAYEQGLGLGHLVKEREPDGNFAYWAERLVMAPDQELRAKAGKVR